MKELETSRHLFQRPLYKSPDGQWTDDFRVALSRCAGPVHLDTTTILSILSFGMAGQDRTMLKEITRRPWMSRIEPDGRAVLEPIPPHGFRTGTDEELSTRLYRLLCDEARTACAGFKEIYILLSGGLDSRIVAGVLADLHHAGEIAAQPVAVTWGMPDSRDVVYAERMARTLGLDWVNIELGPETLLSNIAPTATTLGLLHSPELLHNMQWFRNVSPASLVLAGSFGDSIGRAAFGGLHLLQLQRAAPDNQYGILKTNAYKHISRELNADLGAIHSRAQGDVPAYAKNEHWMQGYRMRGGLCHALCLINTYANIYQMFTAPAVYEFMWSLHPARRDDEIYTSLLERKWPVLARVPWPRTNRALRGATEGDRKDLRANYHEYTLWAGGPLYAELSSRIDPEWFESIGHFDPQGIRMLNEQVRGSKYRVGSLNDAWLWLAGFRTFCEYLETLGKTLIVPKEWPSEEIEMDHRKTPLYKIGIRVASMSPVMNAGLKGLRTRARNAKLNRLKRKLIRAHPFIPMEGGA